MNKKFYFFLTCVFSILLLGTDAKAQTYCTPSTSYNCAYSDYIAGFSTTGGTTNISSTTSCNSSSFTYYSSQSLTVTIGNSFNYTINNNPYYSEYYSMWIDFNRNGTFGDIPSEIIFSQQSISSSGSRTGSITVPTATAVAGASRIRIRCTYYGTMTPCGYTGGGVTQDFVINMNPACTNPSITAQPLSATRCSGDTLSFSVSATTTNTYQWQANGGSGFVNLTDSGIYSGTSTPTLKINSVPVNGNGYMYRAILAGTCPTSVNSNTATLVVANAVNLISQTGHVDSTCEGLPSVLSIQAVGVGLTYQWQVKNPATGQFDNILNIPPYSGANTDNLHISTVDDSLDQHVYRALIFGSSSCFNAPPLPSDTIMMAVKAAPQILPSVISRDITSSSSDTFTVQYPNTRSYQWQVDNHAGNGFADLHDDAIFSGTNTAQLIITNAPASLNGNSFRCLVDGSCSNGLLKSREAMLQLRSTSIAKAANNMDLTIYPNPAVSNITISTTKPWTEKLQLRVIDKAGKTIISDEISANRNNYTLNVKGLAAGTYTVELTNASKSFLQSQQFTKQ